MRITKFSVAAVTALTVGTLLAAVTPANAAPTSLRNRATNFCLDSNAGGFVYTSVCQSGNKWQQWDVTYDSRFDNWGVRNVESGRCLSPYGDKLAADPCWTGTNWHMQRWDRVGERFKSSQDTDWCLDSNGNKDAYLFKCNNSNYQNWLM